MDTQGRYVVYMIHSGNRCYTGYTVDVQRRLRQHNREISGGAKATRVADNWQYFCIITSKDWTACRAMQIEYLCKHPTRQRRRPSKYNGVKGRVASLVEICERVPEPLTIKLRPDLLIHALALQLPSRVTLLPLQVGAPVPHLRIGMDTDVPLSTTPQCTSNGSDDHTTACKSSDVEEVSMLHQDCPEGTDI